MKREVGQITYDEETGRVGLSIEAKPLIQLLLQHIDLNALLSKLAQVPR